MGLEEQLFSAISRSNMMEVLRLLPLGIDINIKNKDGNTPLHVAVLCCNPFMVETLINLKADCNSRNSAGLTVLSTAITTGNMGIVETLLRLGAKHDAWNGNGDLPIHLAAQKGNSDIVKILLRENTIHTHDHDGLSPLHLAVRHNHINAVKTLIEYRYTNINININITTIRSENTALILAVQQDNFSIVKLLLDNRADFARKNKEGKTFNEFAISNLMKYLVLRYAKLLQKKLNADPIQSLDPKPIARKRKNTSSSSENSASIKFPIPKRSKCIDPDDSSVRSRRKRFFNTQNVSSSESSSSKFPILKRQKRMVIPKSSIRRCKGLLDISNISSPKSSQSEYEGFLNESNVNSPGSSLSESFVYKFKKHVSIFSERSSISSINEPSTSRGTKRIFNISSESSSASSIHDPCTSQSTKRVKTRLL